MVPLMNLVQLAHDTHGRRVARVTGDRLAILDGSVSIHCLASDALRAGTSLVAHVEACAVGEEIGYGPVYAGESDWRLLPAFDHPDEPAPTSMVVTTGG